jgi:hypothetical protein
MANRLFVNKLDIYCVLISFRQFLLNLNYMLLICFFWSLGLPVKKANREIYTNIKSGKGESSFSNIPFRRIENEKRF